MRKRNPFNLSHFKLMTINCGWLAPVTWIETIPGDTFQHSCQALIRCQQLLAPLMHPVKVRLHHWFVPIRLLWEEWEDFITGGDDGNDTTTFPNITLNSAIAYDDLECYFGIPPADYTGSGIQISALPFRAYNLIYNNFYRDQQITNELTFTDASGADGTSYSMQYAAWEKDYFTTCRPNPLLGSEVTIPLAENADIATAGDAAEEIGIYSVPQADHVNIYDGSPSSKVANTTTNAETNKMYADLTTATGVEIGDLRLALAQQRFKERANKHGASYMDMLKSLGMRPQDMRLQLPEYLGGGATPLQFSEVLAQDGTNTGKLYGHGIGAMRTNKYRAFMHEHGIVLTLMSVVPKAIYSNGIQRGFFRSTKEMYFQPEYEFTGDQAVYNKEVYSEHTTPDGIFGYQNRYDELRSGTQLNMVAGEFADSTMDHWHLARMFGSDPALNDTFIKCNPATRPFAAPSTHQLQIYARQNVYARRPMARVPKPKTF